MRSRGDMDYEEISLVAPLLETAYDNNIDIYKEQRFNLPLYKTHCICSACPKDAKCIVLLRDPYDVANSFYHYLNGWLFDREDISIDTFVRKFIIGREVDEKYCDLATCLNHVLDAYKNRNRENVLLLHYEDIVANFRACIIMIAEFMGLDAEDNELIDIAEKQVFIDITLNLVLINVMY